MVLLQATDISKTYSDAATPLTVLQGLDFQIEAQDLTVIFGASGTGKSTLLHILGGLDSPTSGKIYAEGEDLSLMGDGELARFRNRNVGFVFQFYHLLAEFSALENVMLPALISGMARPKATALGLDALEAVGLSGRAGHRPQMLSGGEQQRVAIARAAVMRPKIILADEPTGNLDHETGERIIEYLLRLNGDHKIAVVIVTHNRELLKTIPRVYELRDGKLHEI